MGFATWCSDTAFQTGGNAMVRITARTGKTLETILSLARVRDDYCIRLDVSGSFCIDRERPGDEVVRFAGRKVLTLDPYAAELCVSRKLDCNGGSFFFTDEWAVEN
jgi:hypothetical protein